jgi:hypothetical protein
MSSDSPKHEEVHDAEVKLEHSAEEEESLKLVEELIDEISCALDSLGGKESGAFDTYRFSSCKHLHRAAAGFAFLRRAGQVDGSKFLVRPAIEMLFRLEAVNKQPDLFYRIGFSEHLENEKFLQRAHERLYKNAQNDEERIKVQAETDENRRKLDQKWKNFDAIFSAEFSNVSPVDKKLSTAGVAEKATLSGLYDSIFRPYSRYTHGAVEASSGNLDIATTPEDNWIMALCAYVALKTLLSLGAKSLNDIGLFHDRVLRHVTPN